MPEPGLILASASPRRRELLRQIGVSFQVRAVDIDESSLPGESAESQVVRLASAKARAGLAVVARCGQPVLAADTLVVCGERVFGKPADESDALDMLLALGGRDHRVLSAVALGEGERLESRLSKTTVTFKDLTVEECRCYWQTGEPADKAGAYGIQGLGAVFIREIQGSYSGVMGLPLAETAELLDVFGIPYWRTDDSLCG